MQTGDRFFHPWHSLSHGEQAPTIVNAVIEIPQGSKAKYELDKPTGFLRLDRVLASLLHYPFHYGFIPQTYCDDNDPLDVLIICSEPLIPLSIVDVTVLGAVKMVDQGEQDDKIIGVATNDPLMKLKTTLNDLNPEILNTIKQFFEEYKRPENKIVSVERFADHKEAQEIVRASIELYRKKFPN